MLLKRRYLYTKYFNFLLFFFSYFHKSNILYIFISYQGKYTYNHKIALLSHFNGFYFCG
nr:MAG TPA: hypothetical protein [Caudoviricetes sp.]